MRELALYEGGHPFSTADFAWLQSALQASVATIVGTMLPADVDAAIIKGCVIDGSGTAITISDGLPGDWTIRTAGQVIYQGNIYDVLSGEVTGTFTMPYADEVGLKLVTRTNDAAYPTVFYANNIEREVYKDYVLELVTSGWDVPLTGLSLISNTAQSGTIWGFVPPSGTALSDFVDPATNFGIGRWRGWRRFDEADGRVLVGQLDADDDFGTIGDDGGVKTHTLGMTEIPFHRHAVWNASPTGTSGGSNNYVGNTDGSSGPGSASTLTREIYDAGVDVDAAQDARGSANVDPGTMGQPHNNLQPYTTVVYMIKL